MAFACQMRWAGEVSIIITLDWEKRIRVVKLCITFESGPECILTLFWAIYDSVLIQCIHFSTQLCPGHILAAWWERSKVARELEHTVYCLDLLVLNISFCEKSWKWFPLLFFLVGSVHMLFIFIFSFNLLYMYIHNCVKIMFKMWYMTINYLV